MTERIECPECGTENHHMDDGCRCGRDFITSDSNIHESETMSQTARIPDPDPVYIIEESAPEQDGWTTIEIYTRLDEAKMHLHDLEEEESEYQFRVTEYSPQNIYHPPREN